MSAFSIDNFDLNRCSGVTGNDLQSLNTTNPFNTDTQKKRTYTLAQNTYTCTIATRLEWYSIAFWCDCVRKTVYNIYRYETFIAMLWNRRKKGA